jgi:hypothetical protein
MFPKRMWLQVVNYKTNAPIGLAGVPVGDPRVQHQLRQQEHELQVEGSAAGGQRV